VNGIRLAGSVVKQASGLHSALALRYYQRDYGATSVIEKDGSIRNSLCGLYRAPQQDHRVGLFPQTGHHCAAEQVQIRHAWALPPRPQDLRLACLAGQAADLDQHQRPTNDGLRTARALRRMILHLGVQGGPSAHADARCPDGRCVPRRVRRRCGGQEVKPATTTFVRRFFCVSRRAEGEGPLGALRRAPPRAAWRLGSRGAVASSGRLAADLRPRLLGLYYGRT
jgi:hypothetical protein